MENISSMQAEKSFSGQMFGFKKKREMQEKMYLKLITS